MSFDVSKCLIIKVYHAYVEKKSSCVLPLTSAAVKSNSKIALAHNSKGLFLAHTAYLSQVVWRLALKHVFSFRNSGWWLATSFWLMLQRKRERVVNYALILKASTCRFHSAPLSGSSVLPYSHMAETGNIWWTALMITSLLKSKFIF